MKTNFGKMFLMLLVGALVILNTSVCLASSDSHNKGVLNGNEFIKSLGNSIQNNHFYPGLIVSMGVIAVGVLGFIFSITRLSRILSDNNTITRISIDKLGINISTNAYGISFIVSLLVALGGVAMLYYNMKWIEEYNDKMENVKSAFIALRNDQDLKDSFFFSCKENASKASQELREELEIIYEQMKNRIDQDNKPYKLVCNIPLELVSYMVENDETVCVSVKPTNQEDNKDDPCDVQFDYTSVKNGTSVEILIPASYVGRKMKVRIKAGKMEFRGDHYLKLNRGEITLAGNLMKQIPYGSSK